MSLGRGKSTSLEIQDGGQLPNFQSLNSYNSGTHCSISIKFTTDYDHETPDLSQTFKVNGSKVKFIAWHNALAQKIVTFRERIAWLSLNFVQTLLSIAQHVIHVQGHMVKYSNRNNSAVDCSISLKFGTEFDHGTASIPQMFKVKDQKSRSQHNETYQQ